MKYLVMLILLIVVVGGGGYFLYAKEKSAAAASVAPVTEKVERRDVEKVVSANGKVASNRDVDIKCQASGSIKTLPYTDVSVEVQPNAVVCELDPKDEAPVLDTAKAVVEADQARLKEAQMAWDVSKMSLVTTKQRDDAALDSAVAKAAQAHAKANRTKQLYDSKLESLEDLEADQTAAAQADADVQTAKAAIAELDQQKIDVDTKEQQIKEMEAALKQDQTRQETAQQNYDYCTVRAPDLLTAADKADPPRWFISAMLTNIAPGYIVQSGTSGFSAGTTIMTLSDLSHIYVLASVDESDIGGVNDPVKGQTPQDVRVTVDAYPGKEFLGKVVRVAPTGVNTNNVVTFEVKIEVTSPNRMLLRPVMTATAKIIVGSRPNVLSIPVNAFMKTPRDENETADASVRPISTTMPAAQTTIAAEPLPTTPAGTEPTTRRGHGGHGGHDDMPLTGTVSVIKDNGTSETRDVTVGLSDGDYYEVISGLNEDESVEVNKNGADSKWKGQNQNGSFLPRGVGGSGRGR